MSGDKGICGWCYRSDDHATYCPIRDPSLSWDDGLYHLNDYPSPSGNGQRIWVSTGDGTYIALVARSGRWTEPMRQGDVRHFQE